jgi:polygalacturonase
MKRRKFLASMGTASLLPSLGGQVNNTTRSIKNQMAGWAEMDALRKEILKPAIPRKDFPVNEFGVMGDGETDCTESIAEAIQTCHVQGGGRVVFGPGTYRSGPIRLLSGVELHLELGATISFYTDPKRYLPPVFTRWEGIEVFSYSPLIYARDESDIAITGEGTLDGNASEDSWWAMTRAEEKGFEDSKQKLRELLEKDVPVADRVFGEGSNLRPVFVQLMNCERALVKGVILKNAPFWMIHPLMSRHISVVGVTCDSKGPNNDGCDPESCDHVLIEGCTFNTRDDGVAIKAGRNADGRRIGMPSRNIIVSNCRMNTEHTSVAIGSEMSGGVERVYIENLVCGEIQRVFRIKTNSARGGFVRHVFFRNAWVQQASGELIDFKTDYGKEQGAFNPDVRDIHLFNVFADLARTAIQLKGTPEIPMHNMSMTNILVNKTARPNLIEHVKDLVTRNIQVD